jgi:hypothetical protein
VDPNPKKKVRIHNTATIGSPKKVYKKALVTRKDEPLLWWWDAFLLLYTLLDPLNLLVHTYSAFLYSVRAVPV